MGHDHTSTILRTNIIGSAEEDHQGETPQVNDDDHWSARIFRTPLGLPLLNQIFFINII